MSREIDLDWQSFDANRTPTGRRPAAADGPFARAAANTQALIDRIKAAHSTSAGGATTSSTAGAGKSNSTASKRASSKRAAQMARKARKAKQHARKLAAAKAVRAIDSKERSNGKIRAQKVHAAKMAAAANLKAKRSAL